MLLSQRQFQPICRPQTNGAVCLTPSCHLHFHLKWWSQHQHKQWSMAALTTSTSTPIIKFLPAHGRFPGDFGYGRQTLHIGPSNPPRAITGAKSSALQLSMRQPLDKQLTLQQSITAARASSLCAHIRRWRTVGDCCCCCLCLCTLQGCR